MSQVDIRLKSVSLQYQNILQLTGDGVEIPKLTTAQRLALSLGLSDAGITLWDSNLNLIFTWSGTAWVSSATTNYTEGTWVASFIPSTGSITLDPTMKTGRWSKVGNLVTLTLHARVQSISSPTGQLVIDNLPFTIATGFEGAICVAADGLNNGARTSLSAIVNGTNIVVYHYDSGTLNNIGVHVLANSNWYITGSYFT